MKIHILHEFIGGAWGGGNQFLKALREYLKEKTFKITFSLDNYITKTINSNSN